jgi:hypothetical protein
MGGPQLGLPRLRVIKSLTSPRAQIILRQARLVSRNFLAALSPDMKKVPAAGRSGAVVRKFVRPPWNGLLHDFFFCKEAVFEALSAPIDSFLIYLGVRTVLQQAN